MRRIARCVLFLGVPICSARADDWPQWLGSRRDGVWREAQLVEQFPDAGLRVRWRVPVAGGYAGPAVSGGRVLVTDRIADGDDKPAADASGRRVRAGKERVHCLRETDGAMLWKIEYDCPYGIDYASGPRATPTVDGDRVYVLGAEGHLRCLNVNTGDEHWSIRVAGIGDNGDAGPVPWWGMAGHPLVDGNKVFTLTGRKDGVVAALDKRTGETLWAALAARGPGYCPPTMIDASGLRQLIVWHPESINSLDPETGKVHWSVPHGPVENDVSIATPRHFHDEKLGDLLLISDAWNGSTVLKLGRDPTTGTPTAEPLWRRGGGRSARGKGVLHVVMAAPLVRGGHIYGVHVGGQLRCLDALTGNAMWETTAPTHGGDAPVLWSTAFIVPHEPAQASNTDQRKNGRSNPPVLPASAGRSSVRNTSDPHPSDERHDAAAPFRAFIANELGELILAELSPEEYREISRAKLLEPTNRDAGRPVVWSHPAFANRSVYWRNDKELVCASLANEAAH